MATKCAPEQVGVKEDPGFGVPSLTVCSPLSMYIFEIESWLGPGHPVEALGLPGSGTILAMWNWPVGSHSVGPAMFLN